MTDRGVGPMRQSSRLALQLISLVFLVLPNLHAADTLRVSEPTTKVQLQDQTMLVSLGVENPGAKRLRAHVEVELLDPKGESCGKAERDQEISTGSSRVPLQVIIPKLKP